MPVLRSSYCTQLNLNRLPATVTFGPASGGSQTARGKAHHAVWQYRQLFTASLRAWVTHSKTRPSADWPFRSPVCDRALGDRRDSESPHITGPTTPRTVVATASP